MNVLKPPISNPNTDRFNYCPTCGRSGLAPKSEKSFSCPNCGFSFYMNCAAAAMALIQDNKGRLLVTTRAKHPGKGSLDLPGGFAEPGESIEACLIREIQEELNLEVMSLSYFCSFANTYLYKSITYPITDMAFICNIRTFDSICARDDIAGYDFMDLKDFDPSFFGMDSPKRVIQYFIKKQKSTKALSD